MENLNEIFIPTRSHHLHPLLLNLRLVCSIIYYIPYQLCQQSASTKSPKKKESSKAPKKVCIVALYYYSIILSVCTHAPVCQRTIRQGIQ